MNTQPTNDPFQAQASATNFNPHHDALGRFATSDGAAGRAHLGYTGEPTQQKGAETAGQAAVGSILGYAFSSKSLDTCAVATIRSMIATKYRTQNVPGDGAVQAQIVAAAKGMIAPPDEFIDWNRGGIKVFGSHLAAIMQKVLAANGVQTTVVSAYPSARELAAAIIASKQPVAILLHREGTNPKAGHSVTVQWSPDAAGTSQGRFLMNNVTTKGETQGFTKQEFEQGQIRANIRERGSSIPAKMMYYRVMHEYPAVFTKAP